MLNAEALAGALRELFTKAGLDKHVRLGAANQRTVMRRCSTSRPAAENKDLRCRALPEGGGPGADAAGQRVIDYRPLGVVDTPEGARQRVLLVASPRDMIQKLLGAVKMRGTARRGRRPLRLRADPLALPADRVEVAGDAEPRAPST